MPEGDTIARAAAVLRSALAGQSVTGFETALAVVGAGAVRHALTARTIDDVTSRGKHLVMHFSGDVVLRTHLRMHGSWHLYRPGEPWQRAAASMRIRIDTPEWVAVAFNVYDAELVSATNLWELRVIAALGPDLLQPTVDVASTAARITAEGDRPIGQTLLDQRVVAGVGNVMRSEVLFMERLHPFTSARSLTEAQAVSLVRHAVRLLRLNARPGGGARRTTGRLSPDEALWVYQRTGRPCRACGTAIQSDVDGTAGRRVYWCPRCQPTLAVSPR
jgi:endonuclease VIII